MSESHVVETSVGTCFLKRSKRKTLGISVLPDGSVELVAPVDCQLKDIEDRLHKRRAWIAKKRWEFSQMNTNPLPARFCNGASHRYLGKQYRLRILEAEMDSVKLKGGYFEISMTDPCKKNVAKLLNAWMRAQAERQFSQRLRKWEPWCQHRGLPVPNITLRMMPKRWGSCHPDGRIFLNPELIHASSICIDYVITHEICHLRHPQHDDSFFRLLAVLMPNWRKVKERLEMASR